MGNWREEKAGNGVIGRGGEAMATQPGSIPRGELPVQGAKVLIVDDEADVTQALKLRLEAAGYRAAIAHDGAEALKMLQEAEPDLMLVDLMMPHLDGLELTRRVRQNPLWFNIQVLLLSCHDDSVARDLALEFGAFDYLSKTIGGPAIVSRVGEVLAGSKTVRKDADYDGAERDLMHQLRAISQNSAASLPLNAGSMDPLEPPAHPGGAGTGVDLGNLSRALGSSPHAGGSQF